MKKRFKVLRINFALMLLLSLILAACSSESSQTSENDSNDSKGTEEYDLTVAFPYFYGEPADMELVQDEINKIVKEKINATVDFVPLSLSAYRQQMNLMLTSNEKLDLAVVLGDQLSPQVSRGQLHEIDDQIEKYGKGIVDAVGTEYLNATKVDGKQYSVPSVRDLASSYGFVMVKEIVDKYNIDVNNIKTLEDMGEVLRKVKENEPDMTPLVSTN
ncbi:MAG TPA: extracellular solute-binding protein, partial [Metabacillus sp.]|nr:extracellular solute-binding protein [Metabacillus sp.]